VLKARQASPCKEAVLNAPAPNAEMVSRDGNRTPALPHERLKKLARSEAGEGRHGRANLRAQR
jgi:hypothetical protein